MTYYEHLRSHAKQQLNLDGGHVTQSKLNSYLRTIDGLNVDWSIGEPTIKFAWIEKNKVIKLNGASGLTEKVSSVSIMDFLNGTARPHIKTILMTAKLFNAQAEADYISQPIINVAANSKNKVTINDSKDAVIKISPNDRLKFLHVLYAAISLSESEIIWIKQEILDKKSDETNRKYDGDDEYTVIFELVYLFVASMLGLLAHGKKPQISFIFYPAQDPIGNKHLAFAYGLGFNVIIKGINEQAPFEGWLFDTDNDSKSEKMIWRNDSKYQRTSHSSYKYLVFDQSYHGLIQHFANEIRSHIPKNKFSNYEPSICHFDNDHDYFTRLKAVKHYSDDDIAFLIVENLEKEVNGLKNTIPHQTTIRAHKDLQFPLQRKVYKKFGINFSKPSYIKLRSDKVNNKKVNRISINNLPILEYRRGQYHVIDGHTRIHHNIQEPAMGKNYPLGAVIVENCSDELPNPGLSWDDVTGIVYSSEHETDREDSEKDGKARKVEKYTHQENWREWYPELFSAYGYKKNS